MIRSTLLAAAAAASLLVGGIPAQATASITYYGYDGACRDAAFSVNAPIMMVSGTAQLGTPVTLRYNGPLIPGLWTEYVPVLITGLSATDLLVPRLTTNMSSTCKLLVNPDIAVYVMPAVGWGNYVDRWTYNIPSSPAVIGAEVFHQWATIALNSNGNPNPGTGTFDFLLFSNGVKIHAGL